MIKTINISLAAGLLGAIDNHSNALYTSRSEYIRHAIIEQMRIDDQAAQVRQTMAKQLPKKYIKTSQTEEFEISDEYVL